MTVAPHLILTGKQVMGRDCHDLSRAKCLSIQSRDSRSPFCLDLAESGGPRRSLYDRMIIDFHNHFYPPLYLDALEKGRTNVWVAQDDAGKLRLMMRNFDNVLARAHYDMDARVAAMDRYGVDMQCLTMTIPGVHVEQPATGVRLAQVVNDGFAEVIARYPKRLTALAVLPLHDPAASVVELERAVTQLGLRGGILFSHVNGVLPDDERFFPLYEKAIALDVPLWMHPTVPQTAGAMGDYNIVVVAGFLHETTVAVCRMVYGGVLQRFPTLKLVLSQMGGTIPYIAERIERGYHVYDACRTVLTEPPMAQLKRLYMDTTPFSSHAIQVATAFAGVDKILMGSDFPHEIGDLPGAVATIQGLPFAEADKLKILGGNAKKLLKL